MSYVCEFVDLDSIVKTTSFLDRSRVRVLAANCLSKQENFYQHAIEYRLRKFNLKHENLEYDSITDLSNYCNLIEIKKESHPNFRLALAQIRDYAEQKDNLGRAHPNLRKIIVLFRTSKQKEIDGRFLSRWKTVCERENILLVRISDPLEYLDDYIAWEQQENISQQMQDLKISSLESFGTTMETKKKVRPQPCSECSKAMCSQENGCTWRKQRNGIGQCIRYNNHFWEDPKN